jgi:hypothetical protein
LHFSLFGTPLSGHSEIEVDTVPLTDSDLQVLFGRRTGEVGHFEEFVFRREKTGKHSYRWLMAFYELHTFTARVQEAANNGVHPITKKLGSG